MPWAEWQASRALRRRVAKAIAPEGSCRECGSGDRALAKVFGAGRRWP
jgi:hypothetical protein